MKFVRFNGGATGLVVDADGLQIVDVLGSAQGLRARDAKAAATIESTLPAATQSWLDMIDRWDQVRTAFESLQSWACKGPAPGLRTVPFASAVLHPPLAAPTVRIFSFSSNTAVHVQRAFKAMKNMDLSEADVLKPRREGLPPGGFTIWPDTVVGCGATLTAPRGSRLLDYEGECAVYLKKGGRNLTDIELWGYAAWNDLGVRDTHLGLAPEAPWAPFSLNLPKNFDTGNVCGPWVVVDEGRDIASLRCVVKVNGEVRQDWNLADMIYPFEDMFRHVSNAATLKPGDMVTSGTGAGVALESGVDGPHWLKPGDVIEVHLDGAGRLVNTIGAW